MVFVLRRNHRTVTKDIVQGLTARGAGITEKVHLYRRRPPDQDARTAVPGVAHQIHQNIRRIGVNTLGGRPVAQPEQIDETIERLLQPPPRRTAVVNAGGIGDHLEAGTVMTTDHPVNDQGDRVLAKIGGQIAEPNAPIAAVQGAWRGRNGIVAPNGMGAGRLQRRRCPQGDHDERHEGVLPPGLGGGENAALQLLRPIPEAQPAAQKIELRQRVGLSGVADKHRLEGLGRIGQPPDIQSQQAETQVNVHVLGGENQSTQEAILGIAKAARRPQHVSQDDQGLGGFRRCPHGAIQHLGGGVQLLQPQQHPTETDQGDGEIGPHLHRPTIAGRRLRRRTAIGERIAQIEMIFRLIRG